VERRRSRLVAKARAHQPGSRYPDVVALAADVNRYLEGGPVSANRETPLDRIARFSRKHRAAILIVAAYLILRVLLALADSRR
jgi:serine/threonine-protein kinase